MAERTGATLANSDKNHHGVGVNDGEFVYTLHVRGPDANRHRSWASYSGSKDVNGKFVGSHNAFEGWQHDSGISPEFRKRDSDFIRPGEYIKIYAINRATGYIGSTRVYLRNPGQMTEEAPYKSLSQMANTIAMRPPNLKIWAERLGVDVANKAGDSQDYTIGNEGAALQSDQQVVVHTEWLDVDDKPLPAGLAGFGYTGRLARLTRDYYPDVLAGQQATFDITPGRHLEVVNVSNMTHTNDHIYVQVSGEPFNREPSFQRDALTPLTNDDEKFTYNNAHNRDGLLQYRPDRYVPFKVQVWDESATVAAQLAYNQAKVQGLASPASLIKPKPVYQWLYRPELQYSLYQLDINAIEREQNGITTDIQNETTPVIGSTDDLLRVLYDLQGSNKKMPGGFSFTGDKKDELIFAIGANEIKATIGDNQQIVFDDLNALALLDVEDFLSLRLYANNDASNVLWEWAFEFVYIESTTIGYNNQTEETYYVSADDPVVDLKSGVLGYAYRNEELKEALGMRWKATGGGRLTSSVQTTNELGLFDNTLTLPAVKGSTTDVSISLVGDSGASATWKTVEVIAGKPAHITIQKSADSVVSLGQGDVRLDITVTDGTGARNRVEDGTELSLEFGDSLLVKEQRLSTVDGVAYVVLSGGEFSSDEANITVSTGDITATTSLAIDPLNITFTPSKTSLNKRERINISATVTKPDGSPAEGVPVSLSARQGLFAQQELITDHSGQIHTTFTAGLNEIDDEWVVQVGYIAIESTAYTVRSSGPNSIDAQNTMLLADESAAGVIDFDAYGIPTTAAYQTQGDVSLRGTIGDVVSIGDMADPNLEPLLALPMNQINFGMQGRQFDDAHGVNPALLAHVDIYP